MKPDSVRRLPYITLLASLCSAHSSAESFLETSVVSASRDSKALSEVKSSVSKLSVSQLIEVSPVHPGEVLQRIPGITFNRGSGQESLIGLRSGVLTGAGSCGAIQVSQDGIPVRGAGFCNVNQLFDTNIEQANSVEIVRGPSSVLYGSNAIHGAINVLSFPKVNGGITGTNDSEHTRSELRIDVGPHDYGRLLFSSNFSKNKHQFAINVNGASDGGYVDDSGFDQQKINLMHQYNKLDNNKLRVTSVLSASNLNQETAGYLVGTDAYLDDDLREVNFNPEAFRDARSLRFHSKIEGEFDRGHWQITPYFRDTEMTFLMHFLPGTPLEENEHHSIGIQSLLKKSFDNIDLRIGLDLELSEGKLRQSQEGGFGPFPSGLQYDYEVDAQLISPFALVDYTFSKNDSLSAGLRFEHLHYDYDNLMITGNTDESGVPCVTGSCRYSRPEDRTDSFDNATFTLGWLHRFDDKRQFFSNASSAFRAPQSTELYRLQQNQQVSDLDSENVNSLEIGYRASYEKISYEVVIYSAEKSDVIFQDNQRNNVSGAETAHRGIELFTEIAFNNSWQLAISSSYAKHTYENNALPRGISDSLKGNDIDTAPRLSVNANLRWQPIENHKFNLEYIHVDDYFTDESNENSYPGHNLWHLRYQFDASKAWRFSARLMNLTDKAYAERADFSGFVGDRYFVGEPRSLYLSGQYRF